MKKYLSIALIGIAIPLVGCGSKDETKEGSESDASPETVQWSYSVENGNVTITKATPCVGTVVIPGKIEGKPVTAIGDYCFAGCYEMTDVILPESIREIKAHAFSRCGLNRISLPNHVKTIGDFAFAECVALTSIKLPTSVRSIGERAFLGCPNTLFDQKTIPGLTLLGKWIIDCHDSFSGSSLPKGFPFAKGVLDRCESLETPVYSDGGKTLSFVPRRCSGKFVIPDGVTSIGDQAFKGCHWLKSVVIPESVTSIGNEAFAWCSDLECVSIPNSVTSIGDSAFEGCGRLSVDSIPDSVKSIGRRAFRHTIVTGKPIYSDGGKTLLFVPQPTPYYSVGKFAFRVPDGVKTIGKGAFSSFEALSYVEIPNSVESIGDFAFDGCSSLYRVEMSAGVTNIGNRAFADCEKLESIWIPKGVTSIGAEAFICCANLKAVAIPDSVTTIGSKAFMTCGNLETITIPDSVTTIDEWAFFNSGFHLDTPLYANGGTKLVCVPKSKDCGRIFEIPNGVTNIAAFAFCLCSWAKAISIPDSVKSIGEGAFDACPELLCFIVSEQNSWYQAIDGVLYQKQGVNGLKLIRFPEGKPASSFAIPDNVTSIGNGAFAGCSSLKTISIPESVTSIGESAFWGCSQLTSISIPENVTIIGSSAFHECFQLTSISIPPSVKWVGSFYPYESLKSITWPKRFQWMLGMLGEAQKDISVILK